MKSLITPTIVLALTSLAGAAAQAQSVGARLAQSSCTQCHSFGRDEPNGVGPNLFGLLGRPAGSSPGFAYSRQFLEAMKGKTWDRALLEKWLTDTQAVAPGNTMVYFQEDPARRAALIDHIESLK